MLEQQQSQMVSGIRELYRRLLEGESWPGKPLKKTSASGHPLTHDILERLNLLHSTNDTPIKHEGFEDDLSLLQQRCFDTKGSPAMQRKKSISEESEPGLSSDSSHGLPSPARTMSFAESFVRKQSPTTPPMRDSTYRASQISPRMKYEPTPYCVNGLPTTGLPTNGLPAMVQKRGFEQLQLLPNQNWQIPAYDPSMDIDPFISPYSQTTYDNIVDNIVYNQYSPADMLWGENCEMSDYINPNALS